MFGFGFWSFIEHLGYIGIIVIVGYLLYDRYRLKLPQKEHERNKRVLGSLPNIETEVVNVREAAKQNLKFSGMPDLNAGHVVQKVPDLNPESSGKLQDYHRVISTCRANILTKQGPVALELIEMDKGAYLVVSGGSTLLVQKYNLTAMEEMRLQEERQQATDSNDPKISNFLGHDWIIKGAFGEHKSTGTRYDSYSTIRMLTVLPDTEHFRTTLSPELLDGKEHHYYDVRAVNDENEYLYGFYAGGSWQAFIGRKLTPSEASDIKGSLEVR